MTEVLESLIVSAYSKKKIAILRDVNLKLEKLRFLSRLAKDLKYLNVKSYHFFNTHINEIGRMTGGWIKKIEH